MIGGYNGRMLFVDLTSGAIVERELTEDRARNFIGGAGLGARVLYNVMKPGVDPLGPDNVLGFVTGPLTGTGAFFGGRYHVVCKSPVTGGWNDANSGGRFGTDLKRAGFDAVFFTGVARDPVYLWIEDGKAELRDAIKLWGLDTTSALEALITETGKRQTRAALIGPAGEKLSLMAGVVNEQHRLAARGGPGAVMGSKKLKAIAVHGGAKIPVAHPDQLKETNKAISELMKNGPGAPMVAGFGQLGTGMGTGPLALYGTTPIKNWAGVGLVDFGQEAAHKLEAATMDAMYRKRKYTCADCPLGCGADYDVEDGEWPVGETYRPEYETMGGFGALCLNSNAEAIIKCNDICNRYGIDTISVSGTIAWAIECYENGLLSKEETGGIELNWGNAEAIVALTQAIADQTGIGKVLALGSAHAAERLGKGFEYLQTASGIELPMHDPRNAPGFARTYQFDPAPGRHMKSGLGLAQEQNPDPIKYNYADTGLNDKMATCVIEIVNSTGLCQFNSIPGMQDIVQRLMEAVTGWTFGMPEQIVAGERIQNMRHVFNLREGLKPADFTLSRRAVGEPPLEGGPLAGRIVDNRALGRNFYAAMCWDQETGKPSRESLERLGGMDDVIKDLYG